MKKKEKKTMTTTTMIELIKVNKRKKIMTGGT